MHVEICDVSCVLVKTVKTQKQIKYKKKIKTKQNKKNKKNQKMPATDEITSYHENQITP